MLDEGDDLWAGAVEAQQSAGPPVVPGTLWNIGAIETSDVIVWADSQRSAAAIIEAGYQQVLALIPSRDGDLFAPLREHIELVGKMQKIIVAGGGREFVDELARRLGRHRAWRVRWPEDCHDACDVTHRYGMQAVRDAIEGAEPYPIEGIHKPTPMAMLEHRYAPPPAVLTTGCSDTDRIMRFPGEGKLILVTGIPNHGKSTWVTHVMAHTAQEHDRRWAVFSPEMGEWQFLTAQIMAWRAQKPFRPVRDHSAMNDAEIMEGGLWCQTRFAFLACDAEASAPTLDWLLERARACILRDGTTDLLIDPWNEVEHDGATLSETIYIGRCLQRLRLFASRHGCNVWIVAHPTKLKPMKPGEPVPIPSAYDINGGANWANKGDMIIVVYCPLNVTEIHLLKARFRRFGRRGAKAELQFDPITGRFFDAALPTSEGGDEPQHD